MRKISLKGASWDSFFLTFVKLFTTLFNIISAKILSNALSLEQYGTYAQATLINSIGVSVIALGLVDSLNYYYNRKDGDIDENLRKRIINTVFFCEIALGIIFSTLVILGQDIIVIYFNNPAVKVLLPIVSILPVFSNLIYFYNVMLVAVDRAKVMSAINFIWVIIRIVTTCVAVYVVENVLLIFVVALILDVTQIALYEIILRKHGNGINPIKISPSHIKTIFAYSLPMGVYSITSAFSRELDKLVVGRMGGTEDLAIYANCSKVLPLDVIVGSFGMVLIPYIYRRVTEGKKEESIDLFSSYLKVGYYSVWTFGAMILIAPATMISFLYSDTYVSGVSVFILYIFDSMLRFASIHLILTAAGKTKRIMGYSILSMCLNLVLNIIFYYLFGMIGPAIATLISAMVYTFLILNSTIRLIGARWLDVFKLREIIPFVIVLAVTWFLTRLLNWGLCTVGVHAYISMIISMAVFGLTILALFYKKIFGVLKKINSFKI